MRKIKKLKANFPKFIRLVYLKLVRINDTPQRISLGLALGVFCGFFPGTGPIAAITLALILRVNRFAAIIGSIATNTWLSIITLLPAIKLGSMILNLNWHDVYADWASFLSNFQYGILLQLSAYKIILPVLVGYVTIGLGLAVVVYILTLTILFLKKYADKNRSNIS